MCQALAAFWRSSPASKKSSAASGDYVYVKPTDILIDGVALARGSRAGVEALHGSYAEVHVVRRIRCAVQQMPCVLIRGNIVGHNVVHVLDPPLVVRVWTDRERGPNDRNGSDDTICTD